MMLALKKHCPEQMSQLFQTQVRNLSEQCLMQELNLALFLIFYLPAFLLKPHFSYKSQKLLSIGTSGIIYVH